MRLPRSIVLPVRVCAMTAAALMLSACTVNPVPLTEAELATGANDNMARINGVFEPIGRTLDLYEAMARAIKYNLDQEVEFADRAVKLKELDLAHFSLLPTAVANSGYAARDNYSASSSLNLLTGAQNFGASTGQEKKITSADIGFSWSVLDFGLSYVPDYPAVCAILSVL